MQRKEIYATTGPRMIVRFFGGWDFDAADAKNRLPARSATPRACRWAVTCARRPRARRRPSSSRPSRTRSAPTSIATRSSRAGSTRKGQLHEKIYDVAWSGGRKPGADGKLPAVGNTVDVANATWTNTIGAPELIAVWRDPDFDPAQRAFYYGRVIEIPTPRWTAYDAKYFGLKMAKEVPMTTTERAYTSPIWYTPGTEPVMQLMRRLAREPLLHFLLLGGVIFGVYALVTRNEASRPGEIVVTEGRIASLGRPSLASGTGRPPGPSWTGSSATTFATRSWRARRRRSAWTRTTRSSAAACARSWSSSPRTSRRWPSRPRSSSTPTCKQHPDAFRTDRRFTFSQVHLDPRAAWREPRARRRAPARQLGRAGATADISALGDSRLLEDRFVALPAGEVVRQFGDGFAASSVSCRSGGGRVPSSRGTASTWSSCASGPGRVPPLEDVRAAVRREWLDAQRQEANEKFYQSLLTDTR